MKESIKNTIIMRILFGINAICITYLFTGNLYKAGKMSLVLIIANTIVYYIWQRMKEIKNENSL